MSTFHLDNCRGVTTTNNKEGRRDGRLNRSSVSYFYNYTVSYYVLKIIHCSCLWTLFVVRTSYPIRHIFSLFGVLYEMVFDLLVPGILIVNIFHLLNMGLTLFRSGDGATKTQGLGDRLPFSNGWG